MRTACPQDEDMVGSYMSGLEFRKVSSTAIPSFFAVVFNLNFPHSLWQENSTAAAIALSALVKFEPCMYVIHPLEL
jgi:hypothetical protein